MNTSGSAASNALHYRLFIGEVLGLLITGVVTVSTYAALTFLSASHVVFFTSIVFIVVLVLQLLLIYVFSNMSYKNLSYTLEPYSVTLKQGNLSVQTHTFPFDRIRNSSFDQSFIQRFFSVGDVIIDQEPEEFVWANIDATTAKKIMEAVAQKSNIEMIGVAPQNTASSILVQPAAAQEQK